jgi:hypothetical protein
MNSAASQHQSVQCAWNAEAPAASMCLSMRERTSLRSTRASLRLCQFRSKYSRVPKSVASGLEAGLLAAH